MACMWCMASGWAAYQAPELQTAPIVWHGQLTGHSVTRRSGRRARTHAASAHPRACADAAAICKGWASLILVPALAIFPLCMGSCEEHWVGALD